MENEITPQVVKIERPLYEQQQLNQHADYKPNDTNCIKKFLSSSKRCKPASLILNIFPIIEWIKEYKWKSYLIQDLIAGFTVAVMHIPQGMAYSMLGNVSPICGIYMAFFPVFIYFFLGTSRHNSMGTFAIVCLMTGKIVLKHADSSYFESGSSINLSESGAVGYSPIEVATAVTFLVGIIQCGMFFFRLGIVSMLLSESLVSGFTTGVAIHVLTSQVKDMLGLGIEKTNGNFEIIGIYSSIWQNLPDTNLIALSVAGITIVIIVINNEWVKPFAAKYCLFPIPIELIALISGTLISKFLKLSTEYKVEIVGKIPQGFPDPTIPSFSLFPKIIIDCIAIAIISYALTLSMGLIFAQKLNYEINANQELLALGSGNIFGSFFSCLPFCASISRSLIQQTMGGKTQIAAVISCFILFFVLMWIGPFFEQLPIAVLAAIITVALKGSLFNVKDFFKFLKLSKMDAAVWIITFLIVVIVRVDLGLLAGVCISLINVFIMGLKPYACLLGVLGNTDIYLDINRYKTATEIAGLKLFHYRGNINFATKNIFRSELFKTIGINPQKEMINRKKIEAQQNENENIDSLKNRKFKKLQSKINFEIRCLILDFSAINFIDPSGVNIIIQIAEEFDKIGISVFISGCSSPTYEIMTKCGLIEKKRSVIKIFPTIHDAVQFALNHFDLTGPNQISRIKI